MTPVLYIPMLAAKGDPTGAIVIAIIVGVIMLVRWIIEKAKSGGQDSRARTEAEQAKARELMRQMEEYRKRELAAQHAARAAAEPVRASEPRRPLPQARPSAPPPETVVLAEAASPEPTGYDVSAAAVLKPPVRPPALANLDGSPRRPPTTVLGLPLTRSNVARMIVLSEILGTPPALRGPGA
jgi:hypothetical protein